MNKAGLFFFLWLFSIFQMAAQEMQQKQQVWFSYTGQYKVSEYWGYHIEAQFRMDNELKQNQQNVFRIGAVYFLSKAKNISGGYALLNTFNPTLETFFRENRFWEQFQYNKKWSKNTMTHRFRLEQRWVENVSLLNGNATSFGSEVQNRLRYLNRNLFHLISLKSTNEELYAVVQNEVFLTLGDNKINSKLIDQNRFLIGIGLNYNNNIRLEIGYLNHFKTASRSSDVMNHTVSVSLIQNLDLEKQ